METNQKEQEKKGYEDTVRDHLRCFSRTIPSFLMAYGDESVTLANFDRKMCIRDRYAILCGLSHMMENATT